MTAPADFECSSHLFIGRTWSMMAGEGPYGVHRLAVSYGTGQTWIIARHAIRARMFFFFFFFFFFKILNTYGRRIASSWIFSMYNFQTLARFLRRRLYECKNMLFTTLYLLFLLQSQTRAPPPSPPYNTHTRGREWLRPLIFSALNRSPSPLWVQA